MREIKYTKIARKDLDRLFTQIYRDKPKSAKEYLCKIQVYIELLQTNPQMGQECREKGFIRECRVLYYGNYTILYRINKENISILRVLSTKQNY